MPAITPANPITAAPAAAASYARMFGVDPLSIGDGACTIAAMAHWSMLAIGKLISQNDVVAAYNYACRVFSADSASGLTIAQAYNVARFAGWLPARTSAIQRIPDLDSILRYQPVIAAYHISPEWDAVAPGNARIVPAKAEPAAGSGRATPERPPVSRPDVPAPIRPHVCVIAGRTPDAVLIVNSWGRQWGDNGYATLPLAIHRAQIQQLWIMVY